MLLQRAVSRASYQVARLFSPEFSHTLGKWGMKQKFLAPGRYKYSEDTWLFDHSVDNRLGLAAGFDKNGELINVAREYGFGWIEVGSVTWMGGKGNPKPRLFRVYKSSLVNRMGLNGLPAIKVWENLANAKDYSSFAVNIAKTHDPDIMGDKAIRDIVKTYDMMRDMGIYTVLNISCPNTKEGKTFEDPAALKELLHALGKEPHDRPLLVKVSPTLTAVDGRGVLDVCEDFGIKGYVVGNTRPVGNGPEDPIPKGGLSGPPLQALTTSLVKMFRVRTKGTIIACGGIGSHQDMMTYYNAGADFFQAYTGFVRGPNAGPRFAYVANDIFQWRVKNELHQPIGPARPSARN